MPPQVPLALWPSISNIRRMSPPALLPSRHDDTGLTLQSHAIKQAEEEMASIMGSSDNVPFVKVAASKGIDGKDEVLSNRYTDRTGKAEIPVSGVTAGKLLLTFTDDAGNSTHRTIVVR